VDFRQSLKRAFSILVLSIALILIATYILALALGPIVFAIAENMSKHKLILEIPQLIPPNLHVKTKVTIPLLTFYMIAWSIFVACVIYSFRGYDKPFTKAFAEALSQPKAIFNNFFLAMPFISSIAITTVFIAHVVQERAGIPIGTPPEVDYAIELLGLSYSTILEEVCFRLLPIGIPLIFILAFAFKHRLPSDEKQRADIILKGFLRPKRAITSLVKSREEDKLVSTLKTLLIAWSASTFGLLHYSLGDWQIGKILPTTIAGIILAYCYLEYGIEASILIHWIFNVYLATYSLASTFIGETFSTLLDAIMLLSTTTGAAALAILAIHTIRKISSTQQAKLKT